MSGWIGVDFDGTLATYGSWAGASHVGEPVPAMVARVKRWLAEGREVRVFTARVFPLGCVLPEHEVPAAPAMPDGVIITREHEAMVAVHALRAWCREHVGRVLTITCVKDYGMVELFDDRAVQVEMNTGVLVGYSSRGLA